MNAIDKVDVLDKGYVILHDVLGTDLTPVNAARCSYDSKSEELTERDMRLLNYLARHGHTSPFRHAMLQFEIYSPLMVARQQWKYVAGSSFMEQTGDNMTAWNESSRRYIKEEPTFYIPTAGQWRSAPANSKQGSGAPILAGEGSRYTDKLVEYVTRGEELYEEAIAAGVAAEQARLFLPAYGMYVRYYWTASLQAVAHFILQRVADDAQKEIQEYALAVWRLAQEKFPHALEALMADLYEEEEE